MIGNIEINNYIRKILKKYVNEQVSDDDIQVLYQWDRPSGWQAVATISRLFPSIYYDILYDASSNTAYLSVYRRVKTERFIGEI